MDNPRINQSSFMTSFIDIEKDIIGNWFLEMGFLNV